MKPPLLFAVALSTATFAASLAATPEDAKSPASASPAPAVAPWSVVGKWDCTHPAWRGAITLVPDGRFLGRDGSESGHWTLSGMQEHVILVLDWDRWTATAVTMVGPDEFRGKVRGNGPEGEMVMRRAGPVASASEAEIATPLRGPNIEPPNIPGTPSALETRTWRQGEPPVRLLRQDEGFCALSLVTGGFAGGGEIVKVYVADDGYWYLGGQSGQDGVAAQCIIVRYRNIAASLLSEMARKPR